MEGEPTEKEPEVTFEHDCPIEEIADFLSEDSVNEKDNRIKHTPKEAEERVKGFREKPNVTELILRKDGELVGCAFSYEQDEQGLKEKVPCAEFFNTDKDRVFEIKGVHIKSQHRGEGLGQVIMEKLMADTKQKGATKLVLSTFFEEDNPARRLYEKLGFKEVASKQDPHNFYMQYEYPEEK